MNGDGSSPGSPLPEVMDTTLPKAQVQGCRRAGLEEVGSESHITFTGSISVHVCLSVCLTGLLGKPGLMVTPWPIQPDAGSQRDRG